MAEYLGNENPFAITGKDNLNFDLGLSMQYVLHRHTCLNHKLRQRAFIPDLRGKRPGNVVTNFTTKAAETGPTAITRGRKAFL